MIKNKLQLYEEVNRCLLCHDAPCSNICPELIDVAKFIRSVKFENFIGAKKQLKNAKICIEKCKYNNVCETICIRKRIDKAVSIFEIEQYILEKYSN